MFDLYSKKLITAEELEELQAKKSDSDATSALLVSILPKKGPGTYDKFVSVLATACDGHWKCIADELKQRQVSRACLA